MEPERQPNKRAFPRRVALLLYETVNPRTTVRSKALEIRRCCIMIATGKRNGMSNVKRIRPTIRALLLIGPALCLGQVAVADAPVHRYVIAMDESMELLRVEARFDGPVSSVRARSRSAPDYLLDARACGDDTEIRVRSRRMSLPDGGISCLEYRVDLGRASREYRNADRLAPQNIVVSPSYWLWRPSLSDGASLDVEFRLPAGYRVSVPWQALDDTGRRYRLSRSPQSSYAPAIFGTLDYREVGVPGATLRVTLLQTEAKLDEDALVDWVTAAATDVSLAYGYFPNPSPQVVIVPVTSSWASSPVPFGRVIRDGGETVELFINPSRSQEEFLGDWTATHEFSHLMVPYLQSDFHWISEGLAQYYQNILMARAGAYDEREAWQKIYAGLERGRKSRPDLSPNEAASGGVRSSRMKVYWSGAALALMADVTLRERSNGEESLDTVLQRLQACCLPSQDTWTGPEFFAQLDSLIDEPVFMPLYRRYADTVGFPDTSETFERLGLDVTNDWVSISRHAELGDLRADMTRMDMPTARWRDGLINVD